MDSTPKGKNDLVAVLLLIRSRSATRLVFHYPFASDGPNDENSEQPTVVQRAQRDALQPSEAVRDDEVKLDEEREKSPRPTTKASLPNTFLGHRIETLEKILSPGRWCDRTKFEIEVDGITFVGQPCFAFENGSWSSATSTDAKTEHTAEHVTVREPSSRAQLLRDFIHISESLDSSADGPSLATSLESTSTRGSGSGADGMNMFHIIFALKGFDISSRSRHPTASVLYEQVATPLTSALRYLQEQHLYVEIESRKILALKSKARTEDSAMSNLSETIANTSELAWAMKEIFTAIFTSSVAGIRLRGTEMAVQTSSTLGTSNVDQASPYLALLLLEDKSKLLRALDTRPQAAALNYFITHLISTKPLSKLASKMGMPIDTVLFLANHLIKWRKARSVQPLHLRNIYVVAPDFPTDKIRLLSAECVRRFPALPKLEKILSLLGSGGPKQYWTCFQGRNLREPYMELLTWMVRNCLVVRLKTVGWLKVDALPQFARTRQHITISAESDLTPLDEDDNESTEDESVASEDTAIHDNVKIDKDGPVSGRIISDPSKLTDEEAAELLALQHLISNTDLKEHFSRFILFLDGQHALEDIGVVMSIKRSKVEEWLGELDELGVLLSTRCLPKHPEMAV